jgi:hypothetical protein
MVDRPGWSVARLSRETAPSDGKPRISKATIFRYIADAVDNISTARVRLLAEAGDVSVEDALKAAASLLTDEELPDEDETYGLSPKDPIVRAILDGPFTPEFRDRLLRYESSRREDRLKEIQETAQEWGRRGTQEGNDGVD